MGFDEVHMILDEITMPLQQFLEFLPVMAACYNDRMELMWANALMRQHWREPDLRGHRCYEVWGKNAPCKNCPIFSMLYSSDFTAGPVMFELTQEQKNTRHWQCYASLLTNEYGRRLGVLVVFLEITRQRTTEERLEQQMQLADHHRNIYHTLFREMLDACAVHEMIFDEQQHPVDYRFLDVNPAFEQMTRLRAQDVIGHTVREIIPNLQSFWFELYGQVVLTGEPLYFGSYEENLDRFYDVKVFRNAPGQFVCIFQDVSAAYYAEVEGEKMRPSTCTSATIGKYWAVNRWYCA